MDSCKGPTEREYQVNNELDIQNGRLNGLTDVVTDLCTKLSPILQNEPPCDVENINKAALVPLALTIHENNDRISYNIDMLKSTIDRLELKA